MLSPAALVAAIATLRTILTLTSDDQAADQALRDARSRFVAGFIRRHGAMGTLLTSAVEDPLALKSIHGAAHKMAGLGGMLGFPTVTEQAATLETVLLAPTVDWDGARQALAAMAAGFAQDLAGAAPSWAQDSSPDAAGARIMIVENNQEQRQQTAVRLRAAGYRVVTAETGTQAVATARAEQPDLIVLDIDLPGLDGMAVCRQLKLDPALSAIPVMFCSARTSGLDRMVGLTLGADAYIAKPLEPGELRLRIRHLLARTSRRGAGTSARTLPWDLFAPAATEHLQAGPAALVLIRVAPAEIERVAASLLDELRRRDVLGEFGDGYLVALLPGESAQAATHKLRGLLDAVTPPLPAIPIGAGSSDAAGAALETLIAEADLAVARDRVAQSGGAAAKPTILLAEDDPDVLHIIDTRLRAEGYHTIIAVDGQQALDALDAHSPAVLLLDLMMPKVTGFEVLAKLRGRAERPQTIVVSARGRDEDVTRAFDLGADDYVSKPFNPDELVARIARLIR